MNERILELAIKSGHIVGQLPLNTNEKIKLAGLEKFAELIIRECADIADTAEPFKANDLILSHFGIQR